MLDLFAIAAHYAVGFCLIPVVQYLRGKRAKPPIWASLTMGASLYPLILWYTS